MDVEKDRVKDQTNVPYDDSTIYDAKRATSKGEEAIRAEVKELYDFFTDPNDKDTKKVNFEAERAVERFTEKNLSERLKQDIVPTFFTKARKIATSSIPIEDFKRRAVVSDWILDELSSSFCFEGKTTHFKFRKKFAFNRRVLTYVDLFAVQRTIIPCVMRNRDRGGDLLVCAPTGSGKNFSHFFW